MTDAAPRRMRRWMVRLAVSASLLGVLFWFLPGGDILGAIGRVGASDLGLVLAVFLAGHAVAAAKWWTLIGRVIPLRAAIRAHFVGLAANLCLPSVAGGDAVRAAMAFGASRDGGRVIAGGLADRLIDTMALAVLAVAGMIVARDGGGLGLAIAGVLVAGPVLLFVVLPALLRLFWTRIPGLPAQGLADRIVTEIAALRRTPLRLVAVTLLSIAIQGLFILLSWRLARSIGVDIGLAPWVFAWSAAKLLAILPVSLGGIGVRETALAALLVPFGAVAADVVAAGLLWQVVLFLAGGIGGLALLVSGRPLPAAVKE